MNVFIVIYGVSLLAIPILDSIQLCQFLHEPFFILIACDVNFIESKIDVLLDNQFPVLRSGREIR